MAVKTNFLGYVVSDDENKYPDGDVHTDGYYYERVAELNPQMFGMTKYEIGTYTPTSNEGTVASIHHGLGELPKLIIVTTTDIADWDSYYTRAFVSLVGSDKKIYGAATAGDKDGVFLYATNKTSPNYLHSETYFRILPYTSSYCLKAGTTYSYIVMA